MKMKYESQEGGDCTSIRARLVDGRASAASTPRILDFGFSVNPVPCARG